MFALQPSVAGSMKDDGPSKNHRSTFFSAMKWSTFPQSKEEADTITALFEHRMEE